MEYVVTDVETGWRSSRYSRNTIENVVTDIDRVEYRHDIMKTQWNMFSLIHRQAKGSSR